jgi:S-DNA-T family DNA segregation ATPase FtsK/SpoIIIE
MKAPAEKLAWLLTPWQRVKTSYLNLSESLTKKPSPIKRELLALMIFALTMVSVLALMSFSEFDTRRAFGQDDFDNWLGPLGSWLALKLLIYFGLSSLVLPAFGWVISWRLFKGQSLHGHARIWGALLMVLGLLPLLAFMRTTPLKNTFLLGGKIGNGILSTLMMTTGIGGLFIVSITALLCGLVVFVGRPVTMAVLARISAAFTKLKTKHSIKLPSIPILRPLDFMEKKDLPIHDVKPELKSEVPPPPPILVLKPMEHQKDSNFGIQIVERDHKASLSAVRQAEKEGIKKDFSFMLPPLNLLDYDAPEQFEVNQEALKKEAEKLQRAFLQFGIEGKIREIRPGPVVTNYEFVPAPGIKLSRIAVLSDDIAMALSAVQVRIVTPIPGKGAVGIEVPNERRETVYLKEIVADERYRRMSHKLTMAIGKDVEGNPYFMNLADMPHILIAGTTGSGKSVSVNAMICSILYRATPQDVRFLMIDPKMLELSIYSGIPHLLLPPIIDAKKAANALKWAVKEMDQRYSLMKELMVRDISTYNERLKTMDKGTLKPVDKREHEHLPFVVIVVDEYADLLAVAGKEVEGYIMRLAQKARAAGIHVMLATQRPSVDVITGVIKANFPVRMGFRLASSHDSKTIVNKTGAEKLLGRGDVLIMPPGSSDLFRVHGAFISEKELARVVEFLSAQKPPDYREDIADFGEQENEFSLKPGDETDVDDKFCEALAIVREHKKCSTSFLQRYLSIGFNRAARIVDQMEKKGLVGPVLNARGEREIFLDKQ